MQASIDYDVLADAYARNRQVHPGVLQSLCSHLRLTAQSRVLEIGCGTGHYATAVTQVMGADVWGVDRSGQMALRASLGGLRCRVVVGTAEQLPFSSDLFDAVFSVDVIHHLRSRTQSISETFRILAPGGMVAIVTDSEEDLERRVPSTSHFPESLPIERARYPSIATIAGELEAKGFRQIAEVHVELEYDLQNLEPYRERAFSVLHAVSNESYLRGMARLEQELEHGPIRARSLYTLVSGTKPV